MSCISTFFFSLPVVASELAQLEEWFREIFKQLFLISEIPRYSSRKYSRFILQFAVNMLSWSHTVDILCEFNLLCVWLFVRWQNFGKEPLNSHKKVILLRKHWKDCSCYSILVCFGGKHGSFLWTWWEMMRVARNWRISQNAFKGNFLCIHPATRVPWSHQTGGGKAAWLLEAKLSQMSWCNVLPWNIGLVTTPRKKRYARSMKHYTPSSHQTPVGGMW